MSEFSPEIFWNYNWHWNSKHVKALKHTTVLIYFTIHTSHTIWFNVMIYEYTRWTLILHCNSMSFSFPRQYLSSDHRWGVINKVKSINFIFLKKPPEHISFILRLFKFFNSFSINDIIFVVFYCLYVIITIWANDTFSK